jgi:hypothetical protein
MGGAELVKSRAGVSMAGAGDSVSASEVSMGWGAMEVVSVTGRPKDVSISGSPDAVGCSLR